MTPKPTPPTPTSRAPGTSRSSASRERRSAPPPSCFSSTSSRASSAASSAHNTTSGGLLLAALDLRRATRDVDLLPLRTDNDPVAVERLVVKIGAWSACDAACTDSCTSPRETTRISRWSGSGRSRRASSPTRLRSLCMTSPTSSPRRCTSRFPRHGASGGSACQTASSSTTPTSPRASGDGSALCQRRLRCGRSRTAPRSTCRPSCSGAPPSMHSTAGWSWVARSPPSRPRSRASEVSSDDPRSPYAARHVGRSLRHHRGKTSYAGRRSSTPSRRRARSWTPVLAGPGGTLWDPTAWRWTVPVSPLDPAQD